MNVTTRFQCIWPRTKIQWFERLWTSKVINGGEWLISSLPCMSYGPGQNWISPEIIFVTQHKKRMLREGTSLCSMLTIKGDIAKFSKISVNNVFYQLFV